MKDHNNSADEIAEAEPRYTFVKRVRRSGFDGTRSLSSKLLRLVEEKIYDVAAIADKDDAVENDEDNSNHVEDCESTVYDPDSEDDKIYEDETS